VKHLVVLRTYFWKFIPVTCARLMPSETGILAAYGGPHPEDGLYYLNLLAVNRPNDPVDELEPNHGSTTDVLASFTGHENNGTPVTIELCAVDGKYEVIMPSDDGSVKIWDFAAPDAPPRSIQVGNRGVIKIAVSTDGRLIAGASVGERRVRVWVRSAGDAAAPQS
jgi:WD40 repeat protein